VYDVFHVELVFPSPARGNYSTICCNQLRIYLALLIVASARILKVK